MQHLVDLDTADPDTALLALAKQVGEAGVLTHICYNLDRSTGTVPILKWQFPKTLESRISCIVQNLKAQDLTPHQLAILFESTDLNQIIIDFERELTYLHLCELAARQLYRRHRHQTERTRRKLDRTLKRLAVISDHWDVTKHLLKSFRSRYTKYSNQLQSDLFLAMRTISAMREVLDEV